jgi:hypothetical protein
MRKLHIVLPVLTAAFSLPVWAADKPGATEAAGTTMAQAEDPKKKKQPPTEAVGRSVEDQKSPEGKKTHPPTGAMDKAMPTQKEPEKK